MAKYLDQAGLQLVLSKITNKYDGRYLGIHATADAAQKVVHKLTINVRDEESRVFDGTQDFEINVAQAQHIHPATEVTYSNAAVTGAANVNEALDIIVKNIQIGAAAISNATSNMQAVKDALDQEVLDRAAADKGLQDQIDILEGIIDDTIGNGNENLFEKIDNVKEELEGLIDAEVERATAAEAGLREDVDDHEERLAVIQGEAEVPGSIKAQVKTEKDRAEAAEQVLRDNLAAEVARATKAEEDLQDALDDEIANREAADNALSDRITANKNAIDILNAGVEQAGSVDKKVADAEARVKVVTDALDGRMTGAEGRLDVIQGTGEGSIKKAVADLVNGAPETLDTLKEIADALRENPNVLDAIEQAFDVKLGTLEDKHDKEAKKLTDDLAAEVEARAAAVLAEEQARIAADNALDLRLDEIELLIGDEEMSLKDIREAIEANKAAIEAEVDRATAAEEAIQAQLDIVDGAVGVEGSFRKAIKDQADAQNAIDEAQNIRVQNLEDKVGNDGGTAEQSTGLVATLRGAIEAETAERESEDARLEGRIADIEGLIGGEEGSASLKELNDRLKDVEAEQITQNSAIQANAQAIAAIVALDETDIDAAFAAIFN